MRRGDRRGQIGAADCDVTYAEVTRKPPYIKIFVAGAGAGNCGHLRPSARQQYRGDRRVSVVLHKHHWTDRPFNMHAHIDTRDSTPSDVNDVFGAQFLTQKHDQCAPYIDGRSSVCNWRARLTQ